MAVRGAPFLRPDFGERSSSMTSMSFRRIEPQSRMRRAAEGSAGDRRCRRAGGAAGRDGGTSGGADGRGRSGCERGDGHRARHRGWGIWRSTRRRKRLIVSPALRSRPAARFDRSASKRLAQSRCFCDEKFDRCLDLAAVRDTKPSNEPVEGLSRCYANTCTLEHQVQTVHSNDLTLLRVVPSSSVLRRPPTRPVLNCNDLLLRDSPR